MINTVPGCRFESRYIFKSNFSVREFDTSAMLSTILAPFLALFRQRLNKDQTVACILYRKSPIRPQFNKMLQYKWIHEEEFVTYQNISLMEISQSVWEGTKFKEKKDKSIYHIDIIWGQSCNAFHEIVLAVLTAPQSNAAKECVFSIVKKNKTKFYSTHDFRKVLEWCWLEWVCQVYHSIVDGHHQNCCCEHANWLAERTAVNIQVVQSCNQLKQITNVTFFM